MLTTHTQDVKHLCWHPTKDVRHPFSLIVICDSWVYQVLASCGYDDTIKMFVEDQDDWSCAGSLGRQSLWPSHILLQILLCVDSHASTVWACCFDASGKRLVSCSDDRTLKIWQAYEKNNREGTQISRLLSDRHIVIQVSVRQTACIPRGSACARSAATTRKRSTMSNGEHLFHRSAETIDLSRAGVR